MGDLQQAKDRAGEIREALYDIKGQLRADAEAGYPRGSDWRFRAEEARRHMRNELRPLVDMLDEATRPAREAKKVARIERLTRLTEAGRNAQIAKAFRKVVREAVGDAEYQRLCQRAVTMMREEAADAANG